MKIIKLKLLVNEEVHRGKGTPEDPSRHVMQVETLNGDLVFEHDPSRDEPGNLSEAIRKAARITE